ncbi:PilZ domain-containing protein [Devosia sp. UYZn731]|uniref:PilZ domain-containing protein n=1 Tax=Devosia sp. UYZn731 TaxID=3156345 RepID=UPI00339349A6
MATLVAGDGLDRMSVALTDISDAGAGLAFKPSAPLHGEIYMRIPDNILQPCRLVWHRDGRFGISFL